MSGIHDKPQFRTPNGEEEEGGREFVIVRGEEGARGSVEEGGGDRGADDGGDGAEREGGNVDGGAVVVGDGDGDGADGDDGGGGEGGPVDPAGGQYDTRRRRRGGSLLLLLLGVTGIVIVRVEGVARGGGAFKGSAVA